MSLQDNHQQCLRLGKSAQENLALRQVTSSAFTKEPMSVLIKSMLEQLAHHLLARRLISLMELKRCKLVAMIIVMSAMMTIMSQGALA